MLKKSTGNMYPWVTHMHSHLGGECPHKCIYCYVDNPISGRNKNFVGPLRLLEKEFKVDYGSHKIIFMEHNNDLFCKENSIENIERVMYHCKHFPNNTYVFQSKNPARMIWMDKKIFPPHIILGTTIETNRDIPNISTAPSPKERMIAMCNIDWCKTFVTIEPVLDFDVDILADWIRLMKPDFLNLGADSKNHNLPEPTVEKIMELVEKLKCFGIDLREKHNLQRLKPN